jgi:hypothetical protein
MEMLAPYIPNEIIGIMSLNTDDRLNLRCVNKMFRDEVDIIIRSYEEELCDMLRACRISTDKVPKKWLMRYAQEQNTTFYKSTLAEYKCCVCHSHIYDIGDCKYCSLPKFPWRKVLQGPALTLFIVIVCVLF